VEGAEQSRKLTRRRLGAVAAAAAISTIAGAAAGAAAPRLELSGRLVQGGFAIGRASPGARILLDGTEVGRASVDGLFVVGFDRDAPATAELAAISQDGEARRTLQIARGEFDVQRIDGLPEDQVTPTDPALLARIARETQRKNVGFSSRADLEGFVGGFVLPVKGARLAARFGGQRILNGEPKRPHYGDDLAAPVGTPVSAPAAGVVSFAETGLHYEGGLIMIDHGQGLISLYLHLSRIDVKPGQTVAQGQLIGAVGKEGRATGPHLCWRMWWRGRHLDPMLLVGYRSSNG
jgi:murein DD-endopeptidase MepM/ murein hydrolase activator NlpD